MQKAGRGNVRLGLIRLSVPGEQIRLGRRGLAATPTIAWTYPAGAIIRQQHEHSSAIPSSIPPLWLAWLVCGWFLLHDSQCFQSFSGTVKTCLPPWKAHLAGSGEGIEVALATGALSAAHTLQGGCLGHRLPGTRHRPCHGDKRRVPPPRPPALLLTLADNTAQCCSAHGRAIAAAIRAHPEYKLSLGKSQLEERQARVGAPDVSRQTMIGPISAAGFTSKRPVKREGSLSNHPAATVHLQHAVLQ